MRVTSVTEARLRQALACLEDKAKEQTHEELGTDEENDEYFNADDASGGNFDDAYALGVDDGEILQARATLAMLKGEQPE